MLLFYWSDKIYIVCEEQMIVDLLTYQIIDKYQEEKGSKNGTLRHTTFHDTFNQEVAVQFLPNGLPLKNPSNQRLSWDQQTVALEKS